MDHKPLPQLGRSPQKFRPPKRNVQDLLDPDVLDDETRHLLLQEALNPRPHFDTGRSPVHHSQQRGGGGWTSAAAGRRVQRTPTQLSAVSPDEGGATPRHNTGGKVTVAHSPRRGVSVDEEQHAAGFPAQLRAKVKSSDKDGAGTDLVTAMARRLKELEKQHGAYQKELRELHGKYRVLNDKYQREQKQRDEAENLVVTIYEEKRELEQQLTDMRQFLADYGLAWKGAGTPRGESTPAGPPPQTRDGATSAGAHFDLYGGDYDDPTTPASSPPPEDEAASSPVHFVNTAKKGTDLYSPRKALLAESGIGSSDSADPKPPPARKSSGATAATDPVDVALLKKNARILSDYVGWTGVVHDGKHQAGIRDRDVVRVVIYKNGICVNSGPFRPYGWPLCEAFIADLAEGYYPYEFKEKYPDGFPIEVTDRSGERCAAGVKPAKAAPTSEGRRLGGGARQSAPSLAPNVKSLEEVTGAGEYKTVSADEFLKKIPAQKVSATGHLVNVREGVAAILGRGAGAEESSMATVRHVTPAEAQFRTKAEQVTSHPNTANKMVIGDLVAILVRMPNGQKLTLHMRPENTMGDLRREFVTAMPEFAQQSYELCLSFPVQVFTDHSKTLKELGLTKTCTLMVRVSK